MERERERGSACRETREKKNIPLNHIRGERRRDSQNMLKLLSSFCHCSGLSVRFPASCVATLVRIDVHMIRRGALGNDSRVLRDF